MITTFLSDEVINSTELRNNQKQWLDKACENVITIINGRNKFAIMNRERISSLYAQKHYTEIVLGYCQELAKGLQSTTFPWAEYLNSEQRVEFHNELLNCVMESIVSNDWSPVEYLLEDWRATAEVESNPTLAKALMAKDDPSEYVEIKG